MRHQIRKAVKGRQKLRLGLVGPTGSGKTFTALTFAQAMVEGTDKRVGVIDTERESSELYADRFDFDVIQLTESHNPQEYIDALAAFAEAGDYGCVVVDSLSHAWMGKDGALEMVDKAAKRSQSGNSFAAWRDITPLHNRLVDALLAAPFHVITTLRAKMEYVLEEDSRGRKVPRKVGMAPVQRDGMEYEFTVVCDLDVEHNLIVSKTRCAEVDGAVVKKPDGGFATTLRNWIESGEEKPTPVDDASHVTDGYAPDADAPTQTQLEHLEKLLRSHVFTDRDRDRCWNTLKKHHTKVKAGELIEWAQAEIPTRKQNEKNGTREAVEA